MKPLLIDGEWRSTSTSVTNVNPSDTADAIGQFCTAGRPQAQDAVQAAAAAAQGWAESTPQQRHDVLKTAGDEIIARQHEIGRELSREEGKVLAEGIAETVRAGHIFLFFAAQALRQTGEKLASVRPGVGIDITREPVGVVGIITPWNYPIAIPAWKIAPALCFGNAVVFKPAELVPSSAWTLVDIVHRAGLPPGTLNLVYGEGAIVGRHIVNDPAVDAITFTGSVAIGRQIAEAGVATMKKLQLEMGGKNPLVVLDDADVDNAAACAVDGAFFSTGQRCTASSRLIVTEGIHSRFVEAVVERLRHLRVGHALRPETNIGPVVDSTQLEENLKYLDGAQRQGGNVRAGGGRVSCDTDGFFMQPALVTDTTNAMTINREEVFGPIASVIRVRDYDEALFVANETEFGLCAGICTQSLRYAEHFKRHAQAGMVMVNLPTAGVDYHVPFGGRKSSSYGPREQGAYAREFFTTVKTAYTKA
ncbi:MAG: aldehyde dehydrogenase family protein [Hyphomicrobiaceae bacterium]